MQIDWWTFGLQGINFLVLVWLLWRVLFRPVKAIIEKRKTVADRAFAETEAAKQEAAAEKKKFAEARAQLARDHSDMVKAAHEEIEAERGKILDQARRDAKGIVEEARTKIAQERKTALTELRGEIVGLATDLASKILQGAGGNVTGDVFLGQLEDRLQGLPAEERNRLAADLTEDDAHLTVATAAGLDRKEEVRWRERLVACLGQDVEMDFATDAALLGGAELRFPHAVLSCSWADQLQGVGTLLQRDDEAS